MRRLWAALALLIATETTVDANERECRFLRLESDGTLQVEMDGAQRALQLFGVVVPQPPPPLYMDIVGKRIQKQHKPLRCDVRAVGPDGRWRARIAYFAWQDKSGDIWEDLALTLLDQGVARVSDEEFPEREEYLRHQRP
jgi:hypothetical protein